MKLFAVNLIMSLSFGMMFSEVVFYPGRQPIFRPGTLKLQGYYAYNDEEPLLVKGDKDKGLYKYLKSDSVVSDSLSEDSKAADSSHAELQQYFDSQSRRFFSSDLSSANNDSQLAALSKAITVTASANTGTNANLGLLSPFQFLDVVTATNVNPPICVACQCLVGGSCADNGGVMLISGAVGDNTGLALTNPGAVCDPTAGGTISCIITAPPNLSVCDPSCRIASAACLTTPTAANCQIFGNLPICSTACRNAAVGTIVPCTSSAAANGIISSKPSTACATVRKRDIQDSLRFSAPPTIESSQEPIGDSPLARLLFPQIVRRVATSTVTVAGGVTALYVVSNQNCLPSNILTSANCVL